nr:PREDICTED: zinc finger protein 394-like [Linepithema humile]
MLKTQVKIEAKDHRTRFHLRDSFYAAPPQLDLNLVLQSCKVYEAESGSRDFGQDYPSASRSMTNYYSQSRVRNPYPKGTFGDNKPFGCPKCGRCFTVKGNMTRHYKYECGQKPRFQCPYCEFRSKQTSNVMSHVRTKHPGCEVNRANCIVGIYGGVNDKDPEVMIRSTDITIYYIQGLRCNYEDT